MNTTTAKARAKKMSDAIGPTVIDVVTKVEAAGLTIKNPIAFIRMVEGLTTIGGLLCSQRQEVRAALLDGITQLDTAASVFRNDATPDARTAEAEATHGSEGGPT